MLVEDLELSREAQGLWLTSGYSYPCKAPGILAVSHKIPGFKD
jgi:hypothetical protein